MGLDLDWIRVLARVRARWKRRPRRWLASSASDSSEGTELKSL